MRLYRKLARWQQAGLLTEAQAGAILAYERRRAPFAWQSALAFVGVFAILVGIVSIIASNWQLTPAWLKLTGHLLLLIALAAAVLADHVRLTPLVKELCLLAWSGLTLSFIGLTGQVFHLAGSLLDALLLWLALITPAVVVLAVTRIVIVPWLLAAAFTLVLAYLEYLARYFTGSLFPYLFAGTLLPVLLLTLTRHLASRPELRRQLAAAAVLLPIIGASLVCQYWYYDGLRTAAAAMPGFNLALVLGAGILLAFARLDTPAWLARSVDLRLLLAVSAVAIALPFLAPRVESAVLAAASFIALWLMLGWIGHRSGNSRLAGLAILVVTLRIFIIYVEVFGTLLLTGFGLIASGVVLLLMLRGAQKLNRNLRAGPQTQLENH